jgi:hypothetical protein
MRPEALKRIISSVVKVSADNCSCTPGGIGHFLALEFATKGEMN